MRFIFTYVIKILHEHVLRQAEFKGRFRSRHPEAEAADAKVFAVLVQERETQRGAVGAADGLGERETGIVRLAELVRHAPAVAGPVVLHGDGSLHVEIPLGKICARVREFGLNVAPLAGLVGPPGQESGENKVSCRAAGSGGRQAVIGQHFEHYSGDARELGVGGKIVVQEIGGRARGEIGAIGELRQFVEVVRRRLLKLKRHPRGAEAGGVEPGLPLRQLRAERLLVAREGLRLGGDLLLPLSLRVGNLRRDLGDAGRNGERGGGDRRLALHLLLHVNGRPPRLAFGKLGGELRVFSRDGFPRGESRRDFLLRRVTIEHAEENLIHEFAVVRHARGEFREFVFRIVNRARDGLV